MERYDEPWLSTSRFWQLSQQLRPSVSESTTATAQFQIDYLRHQNSLLNQQLATQAASHIQHLQQTLHAQPQSTTSQPTPCVHPSHSPHPPASTPSHPTPSAPSADAQPSSSNATSSPPTNELLKKMGAELKETLESSVRDLREQQRQDAALRELREWQRHDIPPQPSHPPTTNTPTGSSSTTIASFTISIHSIFSNVWPPSSGSVPLERWPSRFLPTIHSSHSST